MQKKRKANIMHERVLDRKRLQKYEYAEETLDDEQSQEMGKIVDHISTNSADTLEGILILMKQTIIT